MRTFWISSGPFDVPQAIDLPAGFDPVATRSPYDVPAPLAAVMYESGPVLVLVCCGPAAPYPMVAS